MSYGLSVFLVPQIALDRACGSNDPQVMTEALAALSNDLADLDNQLDAPDPDDADDISHAEALRAIMTGQATDKTRGSRYGWALRCLCDFLGRSLDDSGFVPCDTDWYFQLDAILGKHNVLLQFERLIYNSPVAIPDSDDWPCVGHWGPDEFAAADQLAAVLGQVDGPEASESLTTALGWLRAGLAQPGSLVIGFHG